MLSRKMNSEIDKYEVFYCADDNEYRVYCQVCDEFCVERYYKNHLKSGTHTNDFYKIQLLRDFKYSSYI